MSINVLKKFELEPYFVIPGLATERGQATARLAWTAFFALYLSATYSKFGYTAEYAAAWVVLILQVAVASVAMCVALEKSESGQVWRTSTTLLDQVIFAVMLMWTGEIAVPFALTSLLLIFSSYLRYGRNYGVLSWTVGTVCTLLAVMWSPYWSQYPSFGVALLATMGLVPPYVFRLIDWQALDLRTDTLTKLRNRRGFDELVNKLCSDIAGATQHGVIVLIDLDGFKKINDEQSHAGGDAVLKHVSYWLNVELSKLGVPARFGGDEFAVIINKLVGRTELETALSRFLERAVGVGELFGSPLSASVGVYYVEPGSVTNSSFVFKAADKLMYLAKKLGKNQYQTSVGATFGPDGTLLTHPAQSEDENLNA
ncbi:GGDEF domain-containing protein [Massilia phyllosphaerae]|uniref:GGDEF domain-containing protein n=1 Tax=Massilia phyllosphaerae TaxID=3106034 RepID=UPI002B1CAA47|nr:GGDEF domain-containing protein [Massilia sp. SGZ-792]